MELEEREIVLFNGVWPETETVKQTGISKSLSSCVLLAKFSSLSFFFFTFNLAFCKKTLKRLSEACHVNVAYLRCKNHVVFLRPFSERGSDGEQFRHDQKDNSTTPGRIS